MRPEIFPVESGTLNPAFSPASLWARPAHHVATQARYDDDPQRAPAAVRFTAKHHSVARFRRLLIETIAWFRLMPCRNDPPGTTFLLMPEADSNLSNHCKPL